MTTTTTAIRRVAQSGVIPWRSGRHGLEIALVTNSRGNAWLVPKGHLEPDLTPAASAAKEAWEEAGLEGRVGPHPLGRFEYLRGDRLKCVTLYPMVVTAVHHAWPEAHRRRRWWVSPRRAADLVFHGALARCILDLGASRERSLAA